MTDSEHAALSAQLAKALGWTTQAVAGSVWVWTSGDPVCRFDYRAPDVYGPLIEWLGEQGLFSLYCVDEWYWSLNQNDCGWADTLPEAVARAVIAIRGEK